MSKYAFTNKGNETEIVRIKQDLIDISFQNKNQ